MPKRKLYNKTTRGYQDRNSTKGIRGKPNQRFLILCEGTKTEPNYFEALGRKIKNKIHLIVRGEGKVSLSLVKEAQKRKDEDGNCEYDEIWCVFDRDAKAENNNQQNFNEAIRLAWKNKIHLAISNDAFELWFVLHFEYYQSQTHRRDFQDLLARRIGGKYNKNDPQIYHKIEHLQENAISFAKKLWDSHDEYIDSDSNEIDKLIKKHNINPSTTVYELVEKLIKYCK